MKQLFLAAFLGLTVPAAAESLFAMDEFAKPPHDYWKRVPADRFSLMIGELKAGRVAFDMTDEKTFLLSVLRALDVPVASQLLVFSSTSLQSRLINMRNPRAIYFNEDTSVGFVPGGRIEIASFDPVAGMVFFIFDRMSPGIVPPFVRSDRCMNCHADTPSNRLPGLVVDSIAVARDGSSLETYRYDENGHAVPLAKRFGGWHLTGGHGMESTHANLIGELSPAGLKTEPNPPGKNCDLRRYPLPTSDILPHLIHEHQVGFINRVIQLNYLDRRIKSGGKTDGLETLVTDLAGYILFSGEAALPKDGISGDPAYASAFLARDKQAKAGRSLREFDLRTRMFKHRCSYMITSRVWAALSDPVKTRVKAQVLAQLADSAKSALEPAERKTIREILAEVQW